MYQGSALLMFGPKMAKIMASWCYYNVTNGQHFEPLMMDVIFIIIYGHYVIIYNIISR